MKRTIVIVLLFICLAGVGVYMYLRSRKQDLTFQTAKVERGDVQVAVTATGKLNPVVQVLVGTQVSGIVSKIYVDFNSRVKKGQVIAEIDKTALLATANDAQANADRARIQLQQAKRDYDRQKQLYEQKVIALMDFQTAESNYKAANSTLQSMESQLNRALVNLKYATIVAPIDGVVISRSVDVGQTVAASFNTPTLFTIANDLKKMQVEASVDEADIGNVKLNQKVDFTVDAFQNETFSGIVKQIRLLPIITQNVVTYSVIVEVSNPDEKLLPGMTANINIILDRHENVLKVPSGALRFIPDPDIMKDFLKQVPDSIRQKFKDRKKREKGGAGKSGFRRAITPGTRTRVWVKNGDTIMPVPVVTGISDGSFTEVKGNLKEDQEVILSVSQPDKSASGGSGAQGQQNPFAPRMPGRGQGGGGGRRP